MKFNWKKKKITNCYTAHYDDYLKTSTDSFMWIFQKTDLNSLYVTLHFFLTVLQKKAFGGKMARSRLRNIYVKSRLLMTQM